MEVAAAAGARCVQYLVWAWHWATPEGGDVPWESGRRLALTRRQTARKRWASSAFRSQLRPRDDGQPVLPQAVMRRFRRPWEVYLT
jgi:hypothetical protein